MRKPHMKMLYLPRDDAETAEIATYILSLRQK